MEDSTFSALCAQSRADQQTWKENGHPKEGTLYDENKRKVKRRLRYCTAQAENRRLLCRDKMFASSHLRLKKTCSRLNVIGTIITDLPYLLEAGANHFFNLAQ